MKTSLILRGQKSVWAMWTCLFAAIATHCPASDPVLVGNWPPALTGLPAGIQMLVTDDFAYIRASDGSINIIDASRVQNPHKLSRWSEPGWFVTDFAVSGRLLILTMSSTLGYQFPPKLQILDVSDPANPQPRGSYSANSLDLAPLPLPPLPGDLLGIGPVGGEMGGGIILPGQPYFGYASLLSSGSHVFMKSGPGLHVVDVGDKNHPVLLSKFWFDEAMGFVIRGDYGYFTSAANSYPFASLVALDFSNPVSPQVVLSLQHEAPVLFNVYVGMGGPGGAYGTIRAVGNYISWEGTVFTWGGYYEDIDPGMGRGGGGFSYYVPPTWENFSHTLDVSNPAAPQLITNRLNGDFSTATILGNRLYETSWLDGASNRITGLRISDITNPFDPLPIGKFDARDTAIGTLLALSEDYAFMLSGSNELAVLSLRNQFPLADAGATSSLFISPNGADATVLLDGSRSFDPDGDGLQYEWRQLGDSRLLANGASPAIVLPVGAHSIQLTVDDGKLEATSVVVVRIITASQAVARVAQEIQQAGLETRNVRPLLATLEAAISAFEGGQYKAALNQLAAFQNKVRAQVAPVDGTLADEFVSAAQTIIVAVKSL